MSRLTYVGLRVLGLLGSVWAVFTLLFAYVAFVPNIQGSVAGADMPASPGDSTLEQYLDWLGWLLSGPEPAVVDPIVLALKYTAVYLVPSLLVAVLVGTGVRLLTVFANRDVYDLLVDAGTLVAVSVPAFLLAHMLQHWFLTDYFEMFGYVRVYVAWGGPFHYRNLQAAVWPGAAMTVYLLAIQSRYAGEQLREYVNAEFVKTARAKGSSSLRVGRHVFRNTAVGLLTVFLTDMYGMVIVGIFAIEYVVGTPGIGVMLLRAGLTGDLKFILSIGVLLASVGVAGTFIQDIAYMLFDPRVDVGD